MSWMATLRKILMLRCEGASELASEALDEPPGTADRLALNGHLIACRSCRRFRRQLRQIHDAARALSPFTVGARPLPPEARARLDRALREAIDSRTHDHPPTDGRG